MAELQHLHSHLLLLLLLLLLLPQIPGLRRDYVWGSQSHLTAMDAYYAVQVSAACRLHPAQVRQQRCTRAAA